MNGNQWTTFWKYHIDHSEQFIASVLNGNRLKITVKYSTGFTRSKDILHFYKDSSNSNSKKSSSSSLIKNSPGRKWSYWNTGGRVLKAWLKSVGTLFSINSNVPKITSTQIPKWTKIELSHSYTKIIPYYLEPHLFGAEVKQQLIIVKRTLYLTRLKKWVNSIFSSRSLFFQLNIC